jgi:lactate racemase
MACVGLPYGKEMLQIRIPDDRLGAVVQPKRVKASENPLLEIERALNAPIGAAPIEGLAGSGRKAAVIIDDNTRGTPTDRMLPPVLRRLESAGVRPDDVKIVIALGTHRPLTREEIARKVGAETAGRHRIVNIPCDDTSRLVYLGASGSGIPAWVNRDVAEADIRIGLGMITPHMDAGFSGGAKIVLPGVCGEATVEAFHTRQTEVNQIGDAASPIRRELENFVAERVPLDFILNAILTGDGALYKCVAGHFIEAHRAGVAYAREVYEIPVRRRYPLVVANAHPNDLDLWQSSKGIGSGERMTADGGTLLLVTRCPEGRFLHPLFAEYVGADPEQLEASLRAGEVKDPIACALGLVVARMKRRIRFSLVSAGLSRKIASQMGFAHFESVESAVAEGLRDIPPGPAVGVLTHGGVTLPSVQVE